MIIKPGTYQGRNGEFELIRIKKVDGHPVFIISTAQHSHIELSLSQMREEKPKRTERYYSKIEVSLPSRHPHSDQKVKDNIVEGYDVNPANVTVTRELYDFTYPRVIKTNSKGKLSRYSADTTLGL